MAVCSRPVMVQPTENSQLTPCSRRRADVGEERLGAPGAVGADQDRMPVPIGVGNLGERGVEDGDVVGGGVRSGVARPQLGGEELAGVVAEREQRVVAEGVLVLCTR